MDSKSQEMFDTIIAMDQDALTDEQKGFLMARRDYFNDEQRKRYAPMVKAFEAGTLFADKEEDTSDLYPFTRKSESGCKGGRCRREGIEECEGVPQGNSGFTRRSIVH